MRNVNRSYGKWVWSLAGLLSLVPAVGAPPGSDDPRTELTAPPGPPTVEVSLDEPWNRQFAHGEDAAAEDGNQVLVAPRPLGPAADGTLSVLVHFDPRLDVANRAGTASPVRAAVRNFAAQRLAWVQYEYEILPNVVNIRGLPPTAVEALKQMPGVLKVEEDFEVHIHHNDSMPLIRAYQSQLQAAGFAGVDGAGIRCCVVDTGIDSNSIMYSTRIDAAAGWDFVNNDSNPEDDNGHGSHVSGTVLGGFVNADFACATTGPESMQGVAPAATLIGVKVLAANGSGSFSNVAAGINRCASPTLPGGPADVINLSLGGGQFSGTCDTDTAAQAVNNAVAAGVVVVASAGNNGYTNAVGTPACASGAIAVAATYDDNFPNCDFPSQTSFSFCLNSFCTSTCTDNSPVVDQRCCFSNRSSKIDVAAPGCITFSNDSTVAAGNGLVGFCGTSQAAPHVAGLAALLLDANPALTPADVRTYIRNGAIDLGAAGFDTSYGWGRIDAINSLALAAPPGCSTDPECSDGLFCNGAEVCSGGQCQAGSDPCPGQACDEGTDTCVDCLTNGDCSDGLFCNGAEVCSGGNCQAGTPVNCADSFSCTADSCNEGTDSCDHVPNNAACDNGLFCDGSEVCNPSSGCQAGAAPCGAGGCDEVNDVCLGGAEAWMVFAASTSVPGVGTVQDEDIVGYDLTAGTWSLIFDGSDVGLGSLAVGGMAVQANGDILLSFRAAGSVPGLIGGPSGTSVDDSDIVRFTPTSLGSTTAGTFNFLFDGSDVGLSASAEVLDAIAVAPDGRLVVSTTGNFAGTGASGADEDLFIFTATSLGSVTSGSFALHFDGSDVSLTATAEDVDAAAYTSAGTLLLSTTGNFSVPGASGANEDVFEFTATSLGSTTAGTYSIFLDLSTIGIASGADVVEVELVEP